MTSPNPPIPNWSISLKSEINRFGAVHTITSVIPEVYSEDIGVRDTLLEQHALALKMLTGPWEVSS